jgi:hypothetical protein
MKVIDALEGRDPEAAAKALDDHVRGVLHRILGRWIAFSVGGIAMLFISSPRFTISPEHLAANPWHLGRRARKLTPPPSEPPNLPCWRAAGSGPVIRLWLGKPPHELGTQSMISSFAKLTLNNGVEMPALGVGMIWAGHGRPS